MTDARSDPSDVEEITVRIVGKILRLLARRDGDAVDDEPDAFTYAQTEAVLLPMSLAEHPRRTSASRAAARSGWRPGPVM